tara:strand:+ start:2570 stop:3325 length:756 start_codon:yes stop_codon:yes gene_type:complete
MPPKRCPPCPPCSSKAKAAPKKRAPRKKAAPKKGVVVKKVGQKCPPSHPVGVIKHTSSGVPVKKHCRGNRGGAAASASTTGGGRVGQTKGKLSAAVLAGIGKAPAKKRAAPKQRKAAAPRVGQTKGKLSAAVLAGIGKAPAKKRAPRKAASKPLIMSFDQSGRITDAKGKIVKRAAREPAGGRFGERGVISVRTLKGDMGVKKGEPKKIKVKVPKRRVGQKKGALSAGIQASLARAREAKARKTNPSSGYA